MRAPFTFANKNIRLLKMKKKSLPKKSVSWDQSVVFSHKSNDVIKIQKNNVNFSQLKSISLQNLQMNDIRKKLCRGSKDVIVKVHCIKCKKNSLIPNSNSFEPYWETETTLFFVTLEEKSKLIGLYESVDTSNGFSLFRVSDKIVKEVVSHLKLNCSTKYQPWVQFEDKELLPSNNKLHAIQLIS